MQNNIKKQIQAQVIPYLQKKVEGFQIGRKGSQFTCPKCKKLSANLFPPTSYTVYCYTPECKKIGDIFDIAREIDFEGNKDITEDDMADILIDELGIKINNEVNKLLSKYESWGWSLFPVVKDTKVPAEKGWTEKSHKDIIEWNGWVSNSMGLGMKCGKDSNVIGIDIDLITKEEAEIWQKGTATKTIEDIERKKKESLEKLMALNLFPETVTQDSGWKGVHFYYQYDADIPKSSFDYEGFHFDIQSDGGYCLIEPSTFLGRGRIIKGETVSKLTPELKTFLLDNIKNRKTENVEVPTEEDNISDKITGLDGNCNHTFVRILGQLRKFMPIKNVERTAHIINQQMLDKPMENKSIKAMVAQIDKYHVADVDTIGDKILEHMKIVDTAHIRDLVECLGFARQDIEQSIKNLVDHKKIVKIKKDLYKAVVHVEWRDDFLTLSKPLGFKVPYFDDIATFTDGSMIVIGAKTGTGKSHFAMNMIKQFTEQNIVPKLITTESDSGIGEIAQKLNLKEGDFKFYQTIDPSSVPFNRGEVRIVDWLRPSDGDFTQTCSIYQKLSDNLSNYGGLLIVFAQLKKESSSFYAENMVEQFASLVCKFLYKDNNGVVDNLNPYITTTKIRRPINNQQYINIQLKYDYVTKLVTLK